MMIEKFIIMKTIIAAIVAILLVGTISPFVNAEGVPAWVKNNAGWWANGTISESEFIQGIQFLIKDGIIQTIPISLIADTLIRLVFFKAAIMFDAPREVIL